MKTVINDPVTIRKNDNAHIPHQHEEPEKESPFWGLWKSERGSLYMANGDTFVCVSVYHSSFRGWIGKVTIRDIHYDNDQWIGWHAFRNPETGELGCWEKITLDINNDFLFKYFPPSIPLKSLVNGYVERYTRVKCDD